MNHFKTVLVIATVLSCAMLVSRSALAMPVNDLAAVSNELSADIQNVRWVCGPFRCWWRPNYYGYGYWGPRHYAYRGYPGWWW